VARDEPILQGLFGGDYFSVTLEREVEMVVEESVH
jgi:hypothetical protein